MVLIVAVISLFVVGMGLFGLASPARIVAFAPRLCRLRLGFGWRLCQWRPPWRFSWPAFRASIPCCPGGAINRLLSYGRGRRWP